MENATEKQPEQQRKVDKICICIAYSGKWTTENKYLDHETKLILVNDEITFEGLVEKISQFLKLERGESKANIWFDTKLETSKGMRVTNDEEVTTCIYLLKNDSNFKTSRFIVDFPERDPLPVKQRIPLPAKRSNPLLAKRRNPLPAKRMKRLPAKDIESIMEPDYSTPEEKSEETGLTSNEKNVRRSARLSKIRKSSTTLSKKRKRSTSRRVDLSTVGLGEDASLDELAVGSIFKDKESLKKCIVNNATKHHFIFKTTRSTRKRYNLKCLDEECKWYMHSARVRDSELFKISKYEKNHTCSVDHVLSEPRHITAKVISDYVIEILRDTKAEKVKPGVVAEEVRKRYGLSISYNKAWRATQLALSVIGIPEQNHEESNAETCTDIERDDLPTVVLGDDASLDEIVKGSIFEDKESLKKCFSLNAIKYHFKFKVERSNYRRYNLKCFDDECSWYVHAARIHDTSLFRINKFEKAHTCSGDLLSAKKHATYKVISDYIIELLHDTGEEITPNFVVEEMKRRHGLEITYNKAWRAMQLAFGGTSESPDEDPELCPSCLHLTDGSNLETCTDIEGDDQSQTQLV